MNQDSTVDMGRRSLVNLQMRTGQPLVCKSEMTAREQESEPPLCLMAADMMPPPLETGEK